MSRDCPPISPSYLPFPSVRAATSGFDHTNARPQLLSEDGHQNAARAHLPRLEIMIYDLGAWFFPQILPLSLSPALLLPKMTLSPKALLNSKMRLPRRSLRATRGSVETGSRMSKGSGLHEKLCELGMGQVSASSFLLTYTF
jgi:hypothetical protein